MDDVQGTSENKFTTIIDLQDLLNMIRMEFVYFGAPNNSKRRNHHIVETNNNI